MKKKILIWVFVIVAILAVGGTAIGVTISLINKDDPFVDVETKNVEGVLSASYFVGGSDEWYAMSANGTESTELVYDGTKESSNDSLFLSERITLSQTHNYVLFEYVFQNTSSENDCSISLTFNKGENDNNYIVSFYEKQTSSVRDSLILTNFVESDAYSFTVGKQESVYFYVMISVDSFYDDMTCNGSFSCVISVVA